MFHPRKTLLVAVLTACTSTADAPANINTDDSSTSGPEPPDPTTEATPTTTSSTTTTTTTDTSDTTTSTTSSTTSTTTTDATTGPLLECGDGELDPGEQCDPGSDKLDDEGTCTLGCQLATCGDGLVHTGAEACDLGDGNNDSAYGGCTESCELGPRCGDGQLQPMEECDLGDKNGTGEETLDGVPCSNTCDHEGALIFLSSIPFYPADIEGAKNGDVRCQELAAAAGLDNATHFKAWLSDLNSSPSTRFSAEVPGLPYALINGLRVANDRKQLFADGPLTAIAVTETGETIYKTAVWTNTTQDGKVLDGALDCEDWTKTHALWQGRVGLSGFDKQEIAKWTKWKAEQQWTTIATVTCNDAYRLYCFEQ